MSLPSILNIEREVPVRHAVDVFVAGGGPAGLAAAVTAARQGRSVFLAEAQSCFGGMGTAGMMPIFMPFGDAVHFYADGFGKEVYDRLWQAGGFGPRLNYGNLNPCVRVEALKRVYDELVAESGAAFAFGTQVIGVEMDGDRIAHVLCAAKSGLFAVRAAMVIDCTGDGDLAAMAGAPFEKGDEQGHMMPGTLISLWAGVDWETVNANWVNAQNVLPRAFADGVFTVQDPHLPGMFQVGGQVAGGNVGHTFGVDGTDERSLTQALVHERRQLQEYARFYRECIPGYERIELIGTAAQYGVRETRRILGDYVLDYNDYNTRAVFDDEIGRYNYWIDIHPLRPTAEQFAAHMARFHNPMQAGESYGIPYRILTPRGLANVLTAGRCVSSDQPVQSSIRVMPGCFITGQAAGMAAAMAVEAGTDTRGIAIPDLQRRLQAMGAFLPNAAEVAES